MISPNTLAHSEPFSHIPIKKTNAIGWLTDFVCRLRLRRLFVDAGAGEGSTTPFFGGIL